MSTMQPNTFLVKNISRMIVFIALGGLEEEKDLSGILFFKVFSFKQNLNCFVNFLDDFL